MGSNPGVSVVIPLYQTNILPKTLETSLDRLEFPKSKLQIIPAVIPPEKKMGYAQAANVGIRKASNSYILLLNSDVKVDSLILKNIFKFLEYVQKPVIIGPKVFSSASIEQISANDLPGINFNEFLGKISPLEPEDIRSIYEPREVNWVSGSVMFFSKSVWKKVKGFDESFFMYWEDADFCLKSRNLGIKTYLLPAAKAWHKGSVSVNKAAIDKVYYQVRNSRIFLYRYSSWLGKLFLIVSDLSITIITIIKIIFRKPRSRDKGSFTKGLLDYYLGKRGQ